MRHAILSLYLAAACTVDADRADSSTTTPWGSGGDASGGSSDGDDGDAGDAGDGSDSPVESSESGGGEVGSSEGASATTAGDDGESSSDDGAADGLDPPAGGSSGGSGGGLASGEERSTPSGVIYRLVAPASGGPLPLLVVYSGTEHDEQMTSNLKTVAPFTGTEGFVFAVLDGVDYNANGQAGADVLDHVRAQYDIDNDRTYLLSESAGTTAGLALGLQLRQSYFAAYWANDVNAAAGPALDAAALGFEPYGNAGPGGDFADAEAIVAAMAAAGYRTPAPAPYDGPGAGVHGDPDQFVAAVQWFPGKTRQ